jgi:hypothetical protein
VATDSLNALVNFFRNYSEYAKNDFWLAGESYAGKYIPDLAVQIDKYNRLTPTATFKLKGQLVGNGVMTFEGGDIQISQTDFMINHEFVDPELYQYWTKSCKLDPHSAGCRFFRQRFDDNVWEINPYSVYDFCYTNDSFSKENLFLKNNSKQNVPNKGRMTQQSILANTIRNFQPINGSQPMRVKATSKNGGYNDPLCAYFDGVHSYFNVNE